MGDRTVNVYFYTLTNPHRSGEGLYRLPLSYADADLGIGRNAIAEALRRIESEQLISWDEMAEVVLIHDALLYLPPTSETQVKGAISKLRAVPRTPLFSDFHTLALAYAPARAEAIEADPLLSECMGDSTGETVTLWETQSTLNSHP